MISYTIFIYSGMFHKFLNVSTYFQNLLKTSIGMGFSRIFQNAL